MILLSKLAVLLATISAFSLFGLIFLFPDNFIILGFAIIIIIGFSGLYILKGKALNRDKFFLLITPLFFLIASLLACIFLQNNVPKLFFSMAVSFAVFLYMENLFLYFYIPAKYNIYSLENISGYLNLISVFLVSFAIYGLKILFGIGNYLFFAMIVSNLFFVTLLIYQNLWINKINFREAGKYAFTEILALSQIYLIIFLLPSSFYVNGLMFTLAYYLISELTKQKLLNKLEKKSVLKYMIISLSLFFILLIVTKWT